MTRRRGERSAASGAIRARRSAQAPPPLPLDFYDRPAELVARELLGARIVSEVGGVRCSAEIVETEAYTGPEDEASHAHLRFGLTPRNAPMYGPPGIAYIYLIYGVHWCLNAVTGAEGYPAAVLIRAARPLEGLAAAAARRPGRPEAALMRGPGNLTRALGIDGTLNARPLDRPPLWIAAGTTLREEEIARGPRIGISRAVESPLRFWIRGSPWVSR